MHRISSHTEDELAAFEQQAEALMVLALHAVMDQIADRVVEHASVPVMAAGPPEDVPGQPYVSPDDLSSITPLWRDQVARMLPLIAEIYNESGGRVHAGLVEAARLPELPDAASAAASGYLAQVQNVYTNVGSDLWETARGELVDGFNNGESIDELAARLRASAGMTARRATLVARSTVVEASNQGSIATARASDLDMRKEWIATNDARTRPTHRTADGQQVDLDASFTVGGFSADVPGDSGLPAQEKYNCRCTVGYVMADHQAAAGQRAAEQEAAQAELPGTSGTRAGASDQIREAYLGLASEPGRHVALQDLRDAVPGISTADFDAAVKQMAREDRAMLTPEENRRQITARMREGSVDFGGEPMHFLSIQADQLPTTNSVRRAVDLEQQARDRQAQIDDAKQMAELLSEADELAANQASARAFAHRMQARARVNTALPAGAADELVAARGADQLDTALDRFATQAGLTRNTARAGQVTRFDPAAMEVIGPYPNNGLALVVRPGYTANIGGEELQVFRGTVHEATEQEAAAFRAAQGESVAESIALERRARREAARSRNREIEAAKPYAAMSSEVDQLIANAPLGWSRDLGRHLDQVRIAARQAGIPQDELIPLSDAIANEVVGPVNIAARELAARHGLRRVGRVGDRVAYDPNTMEPIGEIAYDEGAPVRIWRVGQDLTLADGSTMTLDKAIVRGINTQPRIAGEIMRDSARAAAKNDQVAMAGLADEIGEAFVGDFGGFRTSVVSSSVSNNAARVDGLIHNASGQEIGHFIRNIRRQDDGTLVAHHALLDLDKSVQGSGFAARFNAQMFDYYRRSGIDRVTVFANDDIGGYTWAAQGFDFRDTRAAASFRTDMRSRLRNEFTGPNLMNRALDLNTTPDVLDDDITAFEDLLARAENGEHVTAYQFSQVGRQPGQGGRDAKWLGKALMLGSSWNGVLPL